MAKFVRVPDLKIDAVLGVSVNGRLERRIVWALLGELKRKGFTVCAVRSDEVVEVADRKAAMEEIFNLDDCYVIVRKGQKKHWVRLILGNGIDIVSDWGVPAINDGFDETLDAFNPEVYA